ncbi:hypothetical protein CVS30_10025 [Arthrobacter psychrolactophilus]|uniref:Zinc finger CGNR domain-containing protein n=2 Tax=Arthrobacter psychrolactophilus TaxID=92442 RepID=A0A2V5JL64_9MICC|nr:hypothetical protein CVS30_10025 [Arthrobacter psychrolactophilus]
MFVTVNGGFWHESPEFLLIVGSIPAGAQKGLGPAVISAPQRRVGSAPLFIKIFREVRSPFLPSAALLHYDPDKGLLRVVNHPTSQLVNHAMAHIAEDAAALLTGPDARRIARCAAAPCDRFMIRTHARRQWCSERCGARQRANRAYARKQDKSPAA